MIKTFNRSSVLIFEFGLFSLISRYNCHSVSEDKKSLNEFPFSLYLDPSGLFNYPEFGCGSFILYTY